MNYLSVCSGIEAATVAWHPLGWKAVAYSEIEPFPSAVLAYHYPDVPNVGDMTKFKEWDFGSKTIDLLVGGTPCQSFSVAGLRKGLDDPRGNLALIYCGILDKFRPKWFVWENVPGVLSSNGGRDFGSFLGAVAELGYGFAYRVLDAQYYGVAQRRRRVFVVGHLGNWRSAAEVLFEPESLRRNNPPSRKQGEEVAGTIAARFGISRNNHEECVATFNNKSKWPAEIACTLNAAFGKKLGLEDQHINGGASLFVPSPIFATSGQSNAAYSNDIALCLMAAHEQPYIAFQNKENVEPIALAENTIGRKPENGGNGDGFTEGGPMYTLNATGVHGIAQSMAVRRLTPLECERLQGFPNKYTNIPYRNKPESPDGPRYKALGNSMAVPVMHWIGGRIANVI